MPKAGTDLPKAIRQLCQEKNAIILAHYYTDAPLQQVADFVGDSLQLARLAANTEADIIVMVGVHFMGETCKILCPKKKVLVPDAAATCSLAECCPAKDFETFLKDYPDHTVVTYINTTAELKALTDICVTSSNALQIVEALPVDKPIVFAPDRNLGRYIQQKTGREMVLWDGCCHVHDRFSAEGLRQLREQYPDASILAHPECRKEVVEMADVVGSTAALLKFTKQTDHQRYIVATESGIIFQMKQASPDKVFIPLPPNVSEGVCKDCNMCEYMRMNTLEKVYEALLHEQPEVIVDEAVAQRALLPINKMLELSARLGL